MDARLLALRRRPDGIEFSWSDGAAGLVADRRLRLACPCAFCVHELTGRKILNPEQIPAGVRIRDMQAMGLYAYRILFDDGHDSGIYTLERLHALCQEAPAGP